MWCHKMPYDAKKEKKVAKMRKSEGQCLKPFIKLVTGFPGGAVVKNPPANAGDTGSSPGPGRSHMLRSNQARAPQLLSPCATITEPAL